MDSTGSFFSPITGEPVVWYYRSPEGDYEFFDVPGFHPFTGQRLEPITEQALAAWQSRLAELEEQERRRAQEAERQREKEIAAEQAEKARQEILAAQVARAAAKAEEERREQARLEAMEKMVVATAGGTESDLSIGLAIAPAEPDDALDRLGAAKLTDLLRTMAPAQVRVVHPLFAERFYSEGHFARAYEGDPTPLHESRSLARVSNLALGKVSADCLPNTTVRNMVACDISFAYKIFDKSGSVADANTLTERGPGFSESNGVERGTELLIERHADELFRIFGS